MLVAGDEGPISGIIDHFRRADWRIDQVREIEAAAAKLRQEHFDVVLIYTDASHGVAACETLRAVNPYLKIILFSGQQSTAATVVEAIRSHTFSFFAAPFDVEDARHMIETAAALSDWTNGIEVLSADAAYLTLRLRCAIHTADRLVQFLKQVPVELTPDGHYETAQAFREMLLNAIEHGGKLNPEEWVKVSRIRTRRTLVYHIVDPGEGFHTTDLSHAAISQPNEPLVHTELRQEMGIRAGGFGLLIATHMVDEVIYNEQGNEVVLIKHLA
jgi:anti-sigma regulatory factor (Ser/Thr protein kinase)/ActR/RegA family two-component response regulator